MRSASAAALLIVALAAGPVGCGTLRGLWPFGKGPSPVGDPAFGIQVVESDSVARFYERANAFYQRLALRRFNTLATYRDEVLRDYFYTESAFADYYADFAQALVEAHFEKNRPLNLDLLEFLVDGPGRARVRVRIVGDNGLPLRFGSTSDVREDRWERIEGIWWIVPGKL